MLQPTGTSSADQLAAISTAEPTMDETILADPPKYNVSSSNFDLKVISFNMHGFNQGWPAVTSLIREFNPGIISLQKHWLTPTHLRKFDEFFNEYVCFGGSAMSSAIASGPLKGRPFGGVMCV